MKAEDVDNATPSTLTRIRAWQKWSQVHPTSRVENQKVAKVNSYGSSGLDVLGVEFGTWR